MSSDSESDPSPEWPTSITSMNRALVEPQMAVVIFLSRVLRFFFSNYKPEIRVVGCRNKYVFICGFGSTRYERGFEYCFYNIWFVCISFPAGFSLVYIRAFEIHSMNMASLCANSSLQSFNMDLNPEFVNLDPKYKCVKCNTWLKSPMQIPCGHRICRSCVEELFASNSGSDRGIPCPSGEEGCEEIEQERVWISWFECDDLSLLFYIIALILVFAYLLALA